MMARRGLARIGTQPAARLADARLDRVHRQIAADDARRAHQDLVGVEVEPVGRQLRHQERVPKSLSSGARVGVARVDRQRLHAIALQVQLIDHHRRRLHLVGREHPARVARVRRVDDA
jgi:hypothetical protein